MCRRYGAFRTVIYRESTRCVLGIWNCRTGWFCYVCTFFHNVRRGYVVNKTATYRDPRYMCRGSAKWCVYRLKIKSLKNMFGVWEISHYVLIWHVCGRHETHWTAIYRESTSCEWRIRNCRIRRFYHVCAFSHSVCSGWAQHIGMPNTHAGDQLNVVLYVKKSRVNTICWGSGKYHIMCLFGMCVRDMRRSEPW